MDFGNTLRTLIEERDLTQKQMAIDLNIAPSTIGGYVQNISEPDFKTLKQIAKYFNTSIDYLLDYRSGNTRNHKEDDLLRVFRSITPEQQDTYIEQGKAFIRVNQKVIKKVKSS